MWWWLESPSAVMLLTPLNCVSIVTLVWHRHCTCGLGCMFFFLPQTGKRLAVNRVVVIHQYLPYPVCHTGVLVITVERRSGLEWPPSHPKNHNWQEAFPALWAFSSEITTLPFAARAGPCGPAVFACCHYEWSLVCFGWWSPRCCGIQLSKLFWLQSVWL